MASVVVRACCRFLLQDCELVIESIHAAIYADSLMKITLPLETCTSHFVFYKILCHTWL